MSISFQLLVCSEADADLYAYRRGREAGLIIRIIRGRRCSVLDRCMGELAAALQLPYCFENTWLSLGQCLGEMQWSAPAAIILLTCADRILPRAADDFAQLLRTLGQYAGQHPVTIILHAEMRCEESLRRRLASASPDLQTEPVIL